MDPLNPANPSAAGAFYRSQPNSNGSPASSTTLGSPVAGAKGVGPLPKSGVVPVPRQPKSVRKKPAIALSAAIAAATKMGRTVIDVRALKDEAFLGKFIEQTGGKDLGRFRIALSAQRADDVDRVLQELDAQAAQAGGADSIGTRLAIQQTRIEAIEATTKIGLALLETEEVVEQASIRPPTLPGFGSAIQINVSPGGTAGVTTPTPPP